MRTQDLGFKTLIQLAEAPTAMERSYPLHASANEALAMWEGRVGEIFTFHYGSQFYRGRLEAGQKTVRLFETMAYSPEPPAPRLLMQGMPNRERFLWIIEKAVELGATEIYPIKTEKSYQEEAPSLKKQGGWGRIIRRAARQCRRAILPTVGDPVTLEQAITLSACPNRFYLDRGEMPLQGVGLCGGIEIFVGPEGGWGQEDLVHFKQNKILSRNLGPRLLRTETAAITALSWLASADNPLHPTKAGK
ncbi:RsmE family RNA methyltransferase [Magnetococcus sp. PR-3]|uniref:RsmE family RNA methyltransferase n=1 Tax=Magnetococcus sp. PR-3 TaxID=3120355 RepID=UPI002FCDFF81